MAIFFETSLERTPPISGQNGCIPKMSAYRGSTVVGGGHVFPRSSKFYNNQKPTRKTDKSATNYIRTERINKEKATGDKEKSGKPTKSKIYRKIHKQHSRNIKDRTRRSITEFTRKDLTADLTSIIEVIEWPDTHLLLTSH